jgi:hypothetical protein
MACRNTRVPGHTLLNEGRLLSLDLDRQNGTGRTACACGERSPG